MIVEMWLCWEFGDSLSNGFLVGTIEEANAWVEAGEDRLYTKMELKWINDQGKECDFDS